MITTLFTLLLSACGAQTAETEPDYRLVEDPQLPSLSAEESKSMLSFMCGNRALVTGGALYCLDYGEDLSPVLARYELSDGMPRDRLILAEDCLPEYLTEKDGFIYYVNQGDIERIGTDGQDRQTLREGGCSYLQIHGDKLYFCDGAGRFCSAGLNGGSEDVLISDRCFYPWLMDEQVLYQSHSDMERLRLYDLTDGSSISLTDVPSYAPSIIGDRLYCTVDSGLLSMDLSGLDVKLIPLPGLVGQAELVPDGEGGYVLRCVTDENGPRQWSGPLDEPGEREYSAGSGYLRLDYAGGGYRVDAMYEADGRVYGFLFTTPDGASWRYMAGVVEPASPQTTYRLASP